MIQKKASERYMIEDLLALELSLTQDNGWQRKSVSEGIISNYYWNASYLVIRVTDSRQKTLQLCCKFLDFPTLLSCWPYPELRKSVTEIPIQIFSADEENLEQETTDLRPESDIIKADETAEAGIPLYTVDDLLADGCFLEEDQLEQILEIACAPRRI